MKIIPSDSVSNFPESDLQLAERPRIAYLLSQYPAISHTFFLKETLRLKQLGFQIETCSINPPDRPLPQLAHDEAEEARATYYLKDKNYWGKIVLLIGVLFGNPSVCLRGISLAVRLSRWDSHRHLFRTLYLAEALILGAWMRRRRCDHLHVHFGGPVSTVALLAAHAWKLSLSLTIHGPEEFYDVGEFHLAEKFTSAAFIYCISNYCQSQVMKYCAPKQWKKLRVLPLGVDLHQFHPAMRSSQRDKIEVICVGRLVPAKGQLILLQSFEQLAVEFPEMHLTLVGDGTDRAPLEEFVKTAGLEQRVTFAGARNHEQTRSLLAQADLFVLPSFAEGVPVALMEAMAMAIPCISTQVAGIPELISSGVDGILVPASSIEDLTQAIRSLLLSPELRSQIGEAGRKKVEDRYNLEKNIPRLAHAFREDLAARHM